MPAASKKCQCHFWRPMMIATEKTGCSTFEKYSFKRPIALIHAWFARENFPWGFFARSGCSRAKSGDPHTSRHPTNIHFVRKKHRALSTKTYSVKSHPPRSLSDGFLKLNGRKISMQFVHDPPRPRSDYECMGGGGPGVKRGGNKSIIHNNAFTVYACCRNIKTLQENHDVWRRAP